MLDPMTEPRPVPILTPRHRWRFPERLRLAPELRDAGRQHGLGVFASAVLARRGVTTPEQLAAFLAPPVAGLNDPRRLPDGGSPARHGSDRVRTSGERVMVFGDFDADGLTGLAILVLALRRLGIDARPYVPSRLEEGHGLSLAAVEAAADDGITLIITVDTGSSSVAEVAAAGARDIDVLITDHHHVPDVAPAAAALVNPHRPDARYPDVDLSARASRSPSLVCCSVSSSRPRVRPSSWPISPPSERSATSPRSWARTARSSA